MKTADHIITTLDLQPHPEGGFFKETYRSKGEINQAILGENYEGTRNYSTCIYFLLTSDTYSAFHKINQDEIWHFYDGSPIKIHMVTETGAYSNIIVGNNLENGERPQFVVPGGCWFAAKVINEKDYTLVGCTVSPGFDFRDFILSTRDALISKFPQHETLITSLTH